MNSGGLFRIIWVSTGPGESALTRMLLGANAAAIDRVSASIADLPAAYSGIVPANMNAAGEIRLSTAACSLAVRCGSASWTRNSGPVTLTASDFCHASGVISPNCCSSDVAALFTTTSMPPKMEDESVV